MAEDGEWNLRPGDVVTVYPEMLSFYRQRGYESARLDIGFPRGFVTALENLFRAIGQGEDEMVYVVPQENKEQAG